MLDTTQELLKFSTIGSPIPNRGPAIRMPDAIASDDLDLESGDIVFVGLHYLQRISDAETHGALHIEPGIWLNVPPTQSPPAGPTVVRLATIPHGDSLLAQGPAYEPQEGPPKIPPTSTIPFLTETKKPVTGKYLEVLTGADRPAGITKADIVDPNLLLKRAIKRQTILNTTVISVSTEPDGGIKNIPYIVTNADAVSMESTFWIETVRHPGGECHLDANMVRTALGTLPLAELDVLIIENVGNLVCPAEFSVGADARIMVCSVTEGEDKPLKYPLMFRACELVIVNKIDLLAHLDYDIDRLEANIAQVNPKATTMQVSARTGEGVDAFRRWIIGVPARAKAPA